MLNRRFLILSVIICMISNSGISQTMALNAKISSMVRPYWEFESFWAIPRVGDTKPIVAVGFLDSVNSANVRCLNLEFFEIEKQFRPKAILEREFLHKIMCRSINRALKKTDGLREIFLSTGLTEIGLKFDFLNGWIEIVDVPEPPSIDDVQSSDINQNHHQQDT